MQVKNIGKEKALEKIKHYCGYQERCHREVKKKLYSFGLYKHEVEELMSQLIEEDYLNEERFAIAFAGGKFRILQWGKIKIRYELKQRSVSDYCIKKGLASIDPGEYERTLNKLLQEKLKILKGEKNMYARKAKLHAFLAQKGFEQGMISSMIEQSRNDK